MSEKRILITGAAGQIGSELTMALRGRYGADQVVVTDLRSDAGEALKETGPFEPLDVPAMAMDARWTLDQMAGYLRTWSATQRYLRATGEDPVAAMLPRIAKAWGDPGARHPVRWPLYVRAGRVSGS